MTDKFTIRAVVVGLIFLAVAVVGALTYAMSAVTLAPEQRGTIIGGLITLGSGAAGAVAGILARTTSADAGSTVTTVATGPDPAPTP